MRGLLWFFVILDALLIGYVIYHFTTYQHRPVGFVTAPMTKAYTDSVRVFEQRVTDMEKEANQLRDRLKAMGRHKQPSVDARLMMMEHQIAQLDTALTRMRGAQTERDQGDAFREITSVYGKTSGLYYALAYDTLPPIAPERKHR